jgi:DNA-binding NarL/FixJ family response regulator
MVPVPFVTERPQVAEKISVLIHANDPVSYAGVASQLRTRPEMAVVDGDDVGAAAVALVVADHVDEEALRVVKAMRANGSRRVVLMATHLDDGSLLAAVEAGACGLLRRNEAVPETLLKTLARAAEGDGTVPPDLLGRLLEQVSYLQRQVLAPRGLTFSGLSEREIDVLKLVAEGLDTNEVADRLCYSERTVKNVIHDVTTRLRLRNRTHAVAYAVRQGLI